MWADVRGLIADGPWHGYGHWAFWDRPDLTAETYSALGAYASAHNSWLEVLLGVGIVGLVLFMILCITAVVGVFAAFWQRPSVSNAWWCAVVVFVVAHNMMESFVLWHSAILVLLVASTCTSFELSNARVVDTGDRADRGVDSDVGRTLPAATDETSPHTAAPRPPAVPAVADVDEVMTSTVTRGS
jgi:O-antigen ligase